MKDGQESISKASYFFDSVEYGIVLKDSQIDDLKPEDVSSWNLQDDRFQICEDWLTEKDENKVKPVEESEETYQDEIDIPDIEVDSKEEGLSSLPALLEFVTASKDY